MRNLKRALSLTLASVMLLGMMVVGSSALSFNDADDITNVTAASVLEDLGIMQGDGSGNFMPDKAVTRAQMAIIICRILYGNKLNVSQFEGTTQYTDVGANDYYTGYINLATQLGIIGGYGDGRFGPNDTVTTAQAALMLSRALGYFKGNEIAQAQDWALAAVAQASKIKMFGNLNLSTNAELARDNVAEMVFNAITKTVPVQYNELLGVYYNENKGIIYALTFYYTDTLAYKNFGLVYRSNDTTDYGRPGVTWGTGSYRLGAGGGTGEGNTGSDQYGLNEDGSLKPGQVKMLKNDEIITVAYEPDYTYTANTKQDKVYKDLGRTLCSSAYTWSFYLDGDLKTGDDRVVPGDNDVDWIYTGDGMNTEIYVDSVNETVRVVSIWNYMAEVLRVREDDDGRYIDVRVGNCDYAVDTDYYTADFTEDDYIIVNIDNNERESVSNSNEYFIQDAYETGKVEGTVREVHRWVDTDGNKNGAWVRLDDDSKHDYSALNWYDVEDVNENHPDLEAEYRLYLDPNGFVVGFQALEDISRNYLYVTRADTGLDTTARVVFADGTSKTITVDDDFSNYKANIADEDRVLGYGANATENNVGTYSSANKPTGASDDVVDTKLATAGGVTAGTHKIGVPDANGGKTNEVENQRVFRYSVDKNDVYTLTQLSDNRARLLFSQDDNFPLNNNGNGNKSIVNGAAYITVEGTNGTSRYIVDKKTAFVDVNDKALYTGYDEVPNYLDASFYVVDVRDDKVADVVFIIDGEKYNDNSTYFYVTDINAFSTNKNTYGYDVSKYTKTYVDGKQQDILVDYDKCVGPVTAGRDINEIGLYKIERENDDGVATAITKISGVSTIGTDALMKYRAIAATASSLYTDAYEVTLGGSGKPADSQWVINDETVFVIISGDDYKTVKAVTGKSGARYIIDDSELGDTTDRTWVHVVKDDTEKNVAKLVYVVEGSTTLNVGSTYFTDLFASYGMKVSSFTLNGKPATEADVANAKPGDDIGFKLEPLPGYTMPEKISINGKDVTIPDDGKIETSVPKSGDDAGKLEIEAKPQPKTTKVEITAPETAEGTLTVKDAAGKTLKDGAEVKVGDKLTITATPAPGMELVEITANAGTSTTSPYEYTVVAADVTAEKVAIAAEFKAAEKDTRITVTLKNPDGTDATITKQQLVDGKLVVEFTIPDGAKLDTASMNSADITVGTDFYPITSNVSATESGTTGTITIAKAEMDKIPAGNMEVDLGTIAIDKYTVTVVPAEGWTKVTGDDTSADLSAGTPGNLKIKLKAPKDYGQATVTVKLTVDGIGAAPVERTITGKTVDENGYLALTDILESNAAATGKVTITVDEITATAVPVVISDTLKNPGESISGLTGYSKVVATESNTVIVTADKASVDLTSAEAGAKDVTFTVKLGNDGDGEKKINDWGVKEYTFVITINGQEYRATPKVTEPANNVNTEESGWYPEAADATFVVKNVDKSISIEEADIKVEIAERPYIKSGKIEGNNIILTYSAPVTGTKTYTNPAATITCEGTTMTWAFTGESAADNVAAADWIIVPTQFRGEDGRMVAWQGFKVVDTNGVKSVEIFAKTFTAG